MKRKPKKKSPSELEGLFARQIKTAGLPRPRREYKFLPDRRFKFDFAWVRLRVAVEIEGGLGRPRSGHRSYAGVTRDIEKGRLALLAGWKMLRFTSKDVRDGLAIQTTDNLLRSLLVTKNGSYS